MIEAQPRSKNGLPPHSTTGVAKASCAHAMARGESQCHGPFMDAISPMNSGRVKARLTPKRRFMSASSPPSGSSSADGDSGSRAIPQIGQAPGPSWITWGCIGQVYFEPAAGSGSSFFTPR